MQAHTHTQGLLYHLHFYASFIVLALLGLTHDRNFSIMVGLSPHCLGRERERFVNIVLKGNHFIIIIIIIIRNDFYSQLTVDKLCTASKREVAIT